jgi:hopene-associated glycosyltransferase HpnB
MLIMVYGWLFSIVAESLLSPAAAWAHRTIRGMLALVAGVLTLLIWVYLLFFHGGFWRVNKAVARGPFPAEPGASIAAIVPARNEADVVGRCITSLLTQTCSSLHVYLINDGSSDQTVEVARAAADRVGRGSSLTILEAGHPPAGWSGKLWAVQQGIDRAQREQPDFFLLTDADIEHDPASIATLVQIAGSGSYDLASYMVKLYCVSMAERLLMPVFVFFFLKLYPPQWIANSQRGTAGAAGGCMLLRPEALARAGGIEAIRKEIIDDCALASRVKSTGGRVWLGLTDLAASIRPYGSFTGIGRMISRSAFNQLRHSKWMLLMAMLGLCATYLAPPLLLLSGRSLPMLLGGAAWMLMIAAYLPMIRFYRLNPLWAFLLPLTAVFYMGATLHSAFKFWTGSGGEWKGRIQDPKGSMNVPAAAGKN